MTNKEKKEYQEMISKLHCAMNKHCSFNHRSKRCWNYAYCKAQDDFVKRLAQNNIAKIIKLKRGIKVKINLKGTKDVNQYK